MPIMALQIKCPPQFPTLQFFPIRGGDDENERKSKKAKLNSNITHNLMA